MKSAANVSKSTFGDAVHFLGTTFEIEPIVRQRLGFNFPGAGWFAYTDFFLLLDVLFDESVF